MEDRPFVYLSWPPYPSISKGALGPFAAFEPPSRPSVRSVQNSDGTSGQIEVDAHGVPTLPTLYGAHRPSTASAAASTVAQKPRNEQPDRKDVKSGWSNDSALPPFEQEGSGPSSYDLFFPIDSCSYVDFDPEEYRKLSIVDRLVAATKHFSATKDWTTHPDRQRLFQFFLGFTAMQWHTSQNLDLRREKQDQLGLVREKDRIQTPALHSFSDDDDFGEDEEDEGEDQDAWESDQEGNQTVSDGENADEDDQLVKFWVNPVSSLETFYSSYIHAKCLDMRLSTLRLIPNIMGNFIRYLIAHQVMPELRSQLIQALELTQYAKWCLPRTLEVTRHLLTDQLSPYVKAQYLQTRIAAAPGPVDRDQDDEHKKPASPNRQESSESLDPSDWSSPIGVSGNAQKETLSDWQPLEEVLDKIEFLGAIFKSSRPDDWVLVRKESSLRRVKRAWNPTGPETTKGHMRIEMEVWADGAGLFSPRASPVVEALDKSTAERYNHDFNRDALTLDLICSDAFANPDELSGMGIAGDFLQLIRKGPEGHPDIGHKIWILNSCSQVMVKFYREFRIVEQW